MPIITYQLYNLELTLGSKDIEDMAKFTFCALLGLLLVCAAMGNSKPFRGDRCCTKFQSDPLPLERIRGYSLDRPGKCRLNAVKFYTIKDRVVCANPTVPWAIDAMNFIRNQTASA
ncbi:hypothetical protein AALO_G00010020 [Alosa alosa]|uniref:Chemokine interleukin-8-like domain-containing protein n=1 Tax=Alosa alosa TaxID=278164 RepID=A0AAV6HF82_9TELE|nr:C-C motif chemokine 7 [Alosa alosa]KAG5286013.1 hypothetical protein AALO_G00010020 [Alosa alosa]